MKRISIINAYGYENIGDGAILDQSIIFLQKAILDKAELHIHTANIKSINTKMENKFKIKTILNPYGAIIKSEIKQINDLTKIIRFLKIISISVFFVTVGKFFPNLLPKKGDFEYISSLRNSDLIFGVGGGYLRTKSKYKDLFGFIPTLLSIYVAHFYNKRIMYLPISFGNFASEIHASLAFNAIKNDKILFRDEVSLGEFKKLLGNKTSDLSLFPDLAFYADARPNKKRDEYIVLTARNWLNDIEQTRYEKELAAFIIYVWNRYKLKTIFIPMVWNKIEENDGRVGKKIENLVKNKRIFKIKFVENAEEVQEILAGSRVAICTRMHSAILASIVNTPFICLAYEQKTHGFLKLLGLEQWNIDMEKMTSSILKQKFDKLINFEYQSYKQILKEKRIEILSLKEEIISEIRLFSSN